MVHLWDKRDVQLGLVGLDFSERHPDGTLETVTLDRADYGSVLSGRFGLDLSADDLARFTPFRTPV